jgi:hypothetical protein
MAWNILRQDNYFSDLIYLMVRQYGFDVDAIEENTGLNPLAMAITKGDLHLAEYLVGFIFSETILQET